MNNPDNSIKHGENEVDELVAMLDGIMEQGGSRVSITVNSGDDGITVNTFNTTDCGGDGKTACCQPTEEDAIDNTED